MSAILIKNNNQIHTMTLNRPIMKLFSRAASMMMLAFLLLTASTAWAETDNHKIVVIADPHVMAPELLTNTSNTDWTTYIAGSRKLIDYSKALFDQTVNDIKMVEKPELVLIVGDLTKDGEKLSHDYVKGKLDELKTAGIPTLVIPGNHDLDTSDAKVYGETTTDAAIYTKDQLATLYADYGFGSAEREATTLTYACEPISGLVVIGIDSGKSGVLSETTLNWVCTKATAARAAGKQVIAMMHHPLIPHITGGDMFVETVSVANSANVRNRLADAGIRTIFTGHFHTSDIAKDWNADKTETIYDVTTGSLCSYPCDYRVVTLNPAMTEMSIETNSITSAGAPLGGGDNFTSSIANTRLTTVMTKIITDKLTAANFNSYLVQMAAPLLVNAYIYHAEGNEDENADAQTLLGTLNMALSNKPAYQTLVNSMLQDKSNYGTDREDQTNDRMLTVSTVPGLSIDDAIAEGTEGHYYVNMPKTGTKTVMLCNAPSLTFKVYDDGGKNGNYSDGCNGALVITAPAGYNINVKSNSIALKQSSYHYLNVYDNNSANSSILGSVMGDSYDGSAINYTSTGNNMTLYFESYPGDECAAGLDLTVTLIPIVYTLSYNGVPSGSKIALTFGNEEPNKTFNTNVSTMECIIDGNAYEMDWVYDDKTYYFTYWGTLTSSSTIKFKAKTYDSWTDNAGTYLTAEMNFNENGDNLTIARDDTHKYNGSYTVTSATQTFPTTYTTSATITLNRPIKNGYAFYGWTGTELTAATKDVTITSGSTGNREYTATWGDVIDIKNCKTSVPDQTMKRFGGGEDYSYIYFKFEDAENNPTSNVIGEEITDGNYTLKLGIDYKFGRITFAEPSTHSETVNPCKPGDKCSVEIIGLGDYTGTTTADFTIIGAEVSDQTWGDLTWSLSNGALNIRLTDPANGNKSMPEENRENYPWYPFASYITSVTIQEDDVIEGGKTVQKGITSVGAHAFEGTNGLQATNPNQHIATVSLPSTLTSIGEDAFAYCTGATITIPTSVTSIGDGAFMEVLKVGSSLSDNADNTGMISLLSAAKSNDITLQGRTLWKDGNWNTLCLPFDMTSEQVTAQLAPDALMELDVEGYYNVTTGNPWPGNTSYDGYRQTGFDATSGTLYLYFKDATSITAGKPYIIKWNKPDNYVAYNGENAKTCSDLVSPEFTGVKVWIYDPATKATTSDDSYVTLQGTYAPIEWTDENKSVLFLGVGKNAQNEDVSTLYYPNGTAKTTLGAFRAYFQLNNGLEVGTSAGVKEFKLSFGDEDSADGIIAIDNGQLTIDNEDSSLSGWYTLDGRKLGGKPTQKGIYINNGIKVAIK